MSSIFSYLNPNESPDVLGGTTTIQIEKPQSPPPTLAIVYQFGKVASTSLVATLNRLENVEAKQSHFLGYPALNDALRNLSKPEVPDYFFNHQLGQLYENAVLTRRLTAAQAGTSNERLLIVSVAREPFSWFRSVILQDIVGNLVRLRRIIGNEAALQMSDSEVIAEGLKRLFVAALGVIKAHDGIDKVVAQLPKNPASVFAGSDYNWTTDAKILFFTMLRPFTWFQKHFEPTLGVKVANMEYRNGLYMHHTDRADIFVLNYEDIEQGLHDCLEYLGFRKTVPFERLNRSAAKPFSKDIEKAFATPEAESLIPYFSATQYARQHGYAHLGIPRTMAPFR